jgi:hypothetical protein
LQVRSCNDEKEHDVGQTERPSKLHGFSFSTNRKESPTVRYGRWARGECPWTSHLRCFAQDDTQLISRGGPSGPGANTSRSRCAPNVPGATMRRSTVDTSNDRGPKCSGIRSSSSTQVPNNIRGPVQSEQVHRSVPEDQSECRCRLRLARRPEELRLKQSLRRARSRGGDFVSTSCFFITTTTQPHLWRAIKASFNSDESRALASVALVHAIERPRDRRTRRGR